MDAKSLPSISLRAPETRRDLDRLFRWEQTQKHGYDTPQDAPAPPTRMDLWAFLNSYRHSLEEQGQMRFMIDSEGDTELAVTVGCIDLCDYDAAAASAYVSIFIALSMRRRGYALAALHALAGEARDLGLKRLLAAVSPDNAPSLALFAAAGYALSEPELFALDI